jgi:predicted ester cyclase
MSIEASKALVRRYYEQIAGTGDVDRLADFIAPDYVEVHEGTRCSVGVEGARRHVLGVRETYPDLRLTVEQQVAEGEWVVTRVLMRGTHRGKWMGIRPTGRPVEVDTIDVDRVVDGRIVEHGGAANLLEPLLKVGAIRIVGDEHGAQAPWKASASCFPPTERT